MQFRLFRLSLTASLLAAAVLAAPGAARADSSTGTAEIKTYLVKQVGKIKGAAGSFLAHAEEYQQIVEANGGDYDQAAVAHGPELLDLVKKMQGDYLGLHMNGYETVEGIAAGVHDLVRYDIALDSGVPKSEGSTDSPVAPVTIRDASGKVIADRDGNLYHYVIEPCLYGSEAKYVRKVSPTAAEALHGLGYLPLANVLVAAAHKAVEEGDAFLASSQSWEPSLGDCIGALVWMTPTFNTYFDDLREQYYGDHPSIVSESRVEDMRGIMGSLRFIYTSISPNLEEKDPALARQLKTEYDHIMAFIDQSDARDQRARKTSTKLSKVELEEMGQHAKSLSDQLAPQIKQAAAIIGVQIPRKPYL